MNIKAQSGIFQNRGIHLNVIREVAYVIAYCIYCPPDHLIDQTMGEPFVTISGERVPYTLDNIVRKMAAQKNSGRCRKL